MRLRCRLRFERGLGLFEFDRGGKQREACDYAIGIEAIRRATRVVRIRRIARRFEPLAFETACTLPDCAAAPDAEPNRFYAYGVVARLALLAASIELEQQA